MKVGTYGQKLYFTAKDENGEPIDLTTAREVIAHAKIGDYAKFISDETFKIKIKKTIT
mgnify:CR=1 FL=1